MGSELNCTLGRRGKARRENGERRREGLQTFLTKDSSGILNSSTPSYWSIMRSSVNTRALVTLMREAIWRGRGGPFIFNLGEGAGGIRRVAPVGYDDHPLHKKVFGRPPPPLCPHPMPCNPPPPRRHYIDRCIIFFLSSQRSKEATRKIITPDLRLP